MSLIKDLVDLVDNLNSKIEDRNIKDALFPLREKVIAVQQEMIDMDRKHWEEVQTAHATNVELRDVNSKLRQEIIELKATIKNLSQQKKEQPEFVRRGNVYVNRHEIGVTDANEYCPRCYDVEKKVVGIVKVYGEEQKKGYRKCPQCRNYY